MNPLVDTFLSKEKRWPNEIAELRRILLDCQLVEELKWKNPCYTLNNNNVILLGGFKEFCIISFLKGALLKDPENILVQQGENTQSARVIQFTNVNEILSIEATLKSYIFEAIEVEKSGLKVEYKKAADYEMPDELVKKFEKDSAYKTAFQSLTPGRKKGYLLHFAGAKQSKTREIRIDACSERIFKGKGLNDCICGHSKRMPRCDGSHKYL